MLVDGVWKQDWQPVQAKDKNGAFVRQVSSFRNWVTPDGKPGPTGVGGFPAEAGRYRLYVAYICPWASRTLMVRKLKGLENVIPITVVEPALTEQGWRFGNAHGADEEPLHRFEYMHQLYTYADANFTGRATVPVLWDMVRDIPVNNESADIIRMLNNGFAAFDNGSPDLVPQHLLSDINDANDYYYKHLNNGVYRAGFASTQRAYDEAFHDVFTALDRLESTLADADFAVGNQLTEVDIRLFVTLIRFDVAYHGLFKCNLRRVSDYSRIQAYLERLFRLKGVADTVRFDHIKHGYYSIKVLNPTGIVPIGPHLDWLDKVDHHDN